MKGHDGSVEGSNIHLAGKIVTGQDTERHTRGFLYGKADTPGRGQSDSFSEDKVSINDDKVTKSKAERSWPQLS